jgi:antitoxin CptB|tara:strand:- start:10 stop:279 length:270 start_codon:yes stop_codon:yes gene_type:complete
VTNNGSIELSKIRWRCRRGLKELDFLLLNYFNQKYTIANTEDKEAFLHLLEFQDPALIEFFADPKRIQDPGIRRIISEILGSNDGYQLK